MPSSLQTHFEVVVPFDTLEGADGAALEISNDGWVDVEVREVAE